MTENFVQRRKRVIHRQYNASTNSNANEFFDSFEQKRLGYVRKKPEGLMCSICDGPAHGYNFDAITCESCKAFFRRNALKSRDKFKCRANDGQCVINMNTRKRCKACRLEKCLKKGMRTDWILTEEERLNKRLKIEENRRLRRLLYPDSSDIEETELPNKIKNLDQNPIDKNDSTYSFSLSVSLLSPDDLIKLEQIQKAYRDAVRLTSLPPEIPSYPQSATLQNPWEIVNIPTNILATRSITYFKLLPEFASLCEHDKLILTKFNTMTVAFIRSASNYDRTTDCYHERDTTDCFFSGKDLIKCFSYDQYVKSTRCICRLQDAAQNERLILHILLPISLLSKGLFICQYHEDSEPIAQDIRKIFHSQNVFVDLLWKYCQDRYGWRKSVNIWLNLIFAMMETNLQAFTTLEKYVNNDVVADHLVPLMKSTMLIT